MGNYSFVTRWLGISRFALGIEIIVRFCLILAIMLLGSDVTGNVTIVPELVYKYSYPYLEEQTVSMEILFIGVLGLAFTVFVSTHIVLSCFLKKKLQWTVDAFHYILAISMTALTTYILVQILKVWVSRPRPDFIERCYPNGITIDNWKRQPVCTRPLENKIINDGLQSFPSGHSACAWAVAYFCFLYLKEALQLFATHKPSRIPRCVPFLFGFILSLFSCYVGCSRIWDFKHHTEDVIAGGIIGLVGAWFCFHLYYPIELARLLQQSPERFISVSQPEEEHYLLFQQKESPPIIL